MKRELEGQYRPIPGYPAYEIDQLAHIRKIGKTAWIAERIRRNRVFVKLTGPDGVRKEILLAKVMQITFLPPRPPGKVLGHKNQNPLQNFLSNLEYIDKSKLGKLTGAKANRRPVAKIDQAGNVVTVYASAREAAKLNFMSYQTVIDRCNGKVKSLYALDGHRYVWDDEDVVYSDAEARPAKRGRPKKELEEDQVVRMPKPDMW